MHKNIFELDYDRLLIFLLPTFLRKSKMICWLKSALSPVKVIYSEFQKNRNDNLYKLAHNSQVCYLRKALKDAFDLSLRRIYITDGNRCIRQYIYTNPEQKPVYFGTLSLRSATDYADTGVDFRVILPKGFNLSSEVYYRLKALTDFYKLASKRYLIEINE